MMGLSWTAWLLIVGSVVPSLAMVLVFFVAHRADGRGAANESGADRSAGV